ncbi:MAG: hypothetical protein OZSIB_0170 [Candidatus Ozemobacter sibiricus]|jgi:hypothetical protein|uniref:DUF4276 family protein n=1 Tax=Candidatus Ozemobacter sibiricus TaxID=2268124 RepID=A0A367ZNH0_9BACT|nr:MAG: hypothetical protein OZSIB_0170 [Candidatus Ozemobacter sibiricus]
MPDLLLFVEDTAHETFLTALCRRVVAEAGLSLAIHSRHAQGGAGRMTRALQEFFVDLQRAATARPAAVIVARDANCLGWTERRKELLKVLRRREAFPVILAIPDPHIERWFLIDSQAFKAVFRRGCAAPDQKCARDRYKNLFQQAIREAGRIPLFGGYEHVPDLVRHLDLEFLARQDRSFALFMQDLTNALNELKR